jgi:hypothetical protein
VVMHTGQLDKHSMWQGMRTSCCCWSVRQSGELLSNWVLQR